MANLFNSVKIRNPKRNKFNLSHSNRLTTEFGRLTPILVEPVLPADKFTVSTTLKVRFAPMTFPVMERFRAYIHYWFVPNRIIWDNWESFITGGETGVEDIEHPVPVIKVDGEALAANTVPLSNFAHGSLYDYMGYPAKTLDVGEIDALTTNPLYIDALPFKAYQKIYDEFYRDQNLEQPLDLHTDLDGEQSFASTDETDAFTNALLSLRYRAWYKDYFTSALPDPQRGPDVTLPIFGDIDINYKDSADPLDATILRNNTGAMDAGYNLSVGTIADNDGHYLASIDASSINVDNSRNLVGDGESIRSASINDVRRGFALQRLYELAARVGGRYAENILGNFGVHAGDARLQRPEYLGGSVVPIYVGDVLQTSESGETPLGMPAGVAGALGNSKEFSKTFYEHGWIIGILSIVPEATYMQGIPRKFLKRDRLDYAWPLLANLGEQEIEAQEIYLRYGAGDALNKRGWGYTPRYAEYKFGLSGIHGDFRGNLADFHDARIFDGMPALNKEFVTVKPTGNDSGLNRIFAVNDEQYDHLWVNMYNNVVVRRKLPKYGTPI